MPRYLRRRRAAAAFGAAVMFALFALCTVAEYGAFPHELVEHEPREARLSSLRALWLGALILLVGLISLVRFARPLPPLLPRASVRN